MHVWLHPFGMIQGIACSIHGRTIGQVSNRVVQIGPGQRCSRRVRIRLDGLRMVDAVASPVQWCAVRQIASDHQRKACNIVEIVRPLTDPYTTLTVLHDFQDEVRASQMQIHAYSQQLFNRSIYQAATTSTKTLPSPHCHVTHIIQELQIRIGILLHGVAEADAMQGFLGCECVASHHRWCCYNWWWRCYRCWCWCGGAGACM